LHNQPHHTYTEDRVARMLTRRIERKIEDVRESLDSEEEKELAMQVGCLE